MLGLWVFYPNYNNIPIISYGIQFYLRRRKLTKTCRENTWTATSYFTTISNYLWRKLKKICRENNDLPQVPLATSGAGTAYPFGAHEFSPPPILSGVCVTRSLVLCVMFCRWLFVLLLLAIVLSVLLLLAIVLSVLLWFTDSEYPFDIFKIFLHYHHQ